MTDAPQPPSSAPSLASGQTPQPGLEPGPAKKMRVAAVGDLHVGEDARRPYRDLFERVSDDADVLCLCGDLTNYGKTPEVERLLEDLKLCKIPMVGVLGNHEHECGQPEVVTKSFEEFSSALLEALAIVLVVSFISYLVWFWLLRRYLAANLAVFSFITPLFGVTFGVLLLDEPLSVNFVLGAVMVLLGVILVSAEPWVKQQLRKWVG